jgi:MFS family permease
MPAASTSTPDTSAVPLNRNQIRGFWAAWGGWSLDGMDSFIYALVLVPSLRDLLPRSGIPATKGNIGFYGGLLFALFLVGWGLAFLWGPVGDKFGRVRALMLTVAWYSVFTFLSAIVTTVGQLAVLRLLAGIGIGGEWAMGGTFVAEEWPEQRRRTGAGYMHTGYYVGIFVAAIANYAIGGRFGHNGWRILFAVGGLPALLLAWVRHGVTEPSRWKEKAPVVHSWKIWRPFAALFSESLRRRTILNAIFMLVSICGLWAGTVYVPSAVITLAEAGGRVSAAAQFASRATMLVAFATIIGCLLMPWLAERLGRRGALAFYFALMFVFIALTFGKVFYIGSLPLFFVCLFFLGLGGANFAVYTLWLPEQYPTECRASAFAFSTSFARFGGAAITFLVGAGVQHYGSLGIPVALTSLAFAAGLLLIPFGLETRGQALPA